MKQGKNENCKTPWFLIEFENAISMKKEALKCFREIPTPFNKTGLLKISLETSFTVKKAKCTLLSNCMDKFEKIYGTFNKMTSMRSVKTILSFRKQLYDTINSPKVFVDRFNKKFVDVATTAEAPFTQEPKECINTIDIFDNIMFASPTKLT